MASRPVASTGPVGLPKAQLPGLRSWVMEGASGAKANSFICSVKAYYSSEQAHIAHFRDWVTRSVFTFKRLLMVSDLEEGLVAKLLH